MIDTNGCVPGTVTGSREVEKRVGAVDCACLADSLLSALAFFPLPALLLPVATPPDEVDVTDPPPFWDESGGRPLISVIVTLQESTLSPKP